MSSRVRVTKTIDEGYNFDVEHKNWELRVPWQEKFLLLLITFLPTAIINLAYFLFRDILLSQMLFQLSLIILPVIYNQIYPLNLDILYIQYVKQVPAQIKQGIFLFFLYMLAIPSIAILLKYFQVNILEGMIFMIPSGLSPLTKFQRGVHFTYFSLLSIVFAIMAPIAEFRYYLIFLQSKFNNSALSYFLMFILLTLNSSVVILYVVVYGQMNFVYLFVAVLLLSNYRLLKMKKQSGIITTLLRQFGINFGFILLMLISIYSSYIIEQRKDITLFVDKNAVDMMIDGFIWDDPNYDSSF